MTNTLDQFKATYFTEAAELVEEMERCLLALESGAHNAAQTDALFRAVHSIKGGALAFGFDAIARFTHVVETLLDQLRAGELILTSTLMDGLLASRDVIASMLLATQEETALPTAEAEAVMVLLSQVFDKKAVASVPVITTAATAQSSEETYAIHFVPQPELFLTGNDPMRIIAELRGLGALTITADYSAVPSLSELDPTTSYIRWSMLLTTTADSVAVREVFEFVEHISTVEIAREAQSSAQSAPAIAVDELASKTTTASTTIRVETEKVDRLMNMVGELLIAQSMLASHLMQSKLYHYGEVGADIDTLALRARELQEAVMAIRMQPVKSLFARMPRMVRDTAQQLGKQVNLVIEGEQTELDKTVIEKLADPLSHMIRNAIDHGIETPQSRRAMGKPEQGIVHLKAYPRSGRIMIEVRDDGAGMNRSRILEKAHERGLVPTDKVLSDNEIDQLIFLPGFSTAETVTNVSGRGVGMDVVRKNIESIGGSVRLMNTPQQGTVFTLSLPLTLASLDGMVVRVGSENYIIPIAAIIETLRPNAEDVRRLNDQCEVVQVRGECIRLVALHRLFNITGAMHDPSKALVVLVEYGDEKIGLIVDELLGQQQVIVKTIAAATGAMRGFSGTTILGDGTVSLILEINDVCAPNMRSSAPAIQQVA